jgi:hypothetical protein
MGKVLCWQLYALFCCVFLVLHTIVKGRVPVIAFEDLHELVLIPTIYFNRVTDLGTVCPVDI